MESRDLTPEQLDKLLHGIARTRDYTFRLVERTKATGFPETDPLRGSAGRACDAVEALYQMAAELERKAQLPWWAGGQKPMEREPRDPRARRG
jgi:hypothetical protein